MDTTIDCTPGDCLVKSDEWTTGLKGTYTTNGYIYASIAGTVELVNNEDNTKTVQVVGVEVRRHLVPQLDSLVTCRVLSMTSSLVRVHIHCIDGHVLRQPFRAVLKKEAINAVDNQKTQTWHSMRPSDIIVAKVIGFADNNYLLSTAHNELGVVVALNQSSQPMKPISWTEMSCPVTYGCERRKVAQLGANPSL